MKTIILSLILISTLFFVSLTSAGVTVDKTIVNVTAGDSFILTYTVTGSTSDCFVTVNITPDDEGFQLSYDNQFKLPSTFVLYINTSMLLVPGTYYITTTFSTESFSSPKVSRRINHVTEAESQVPIVPVNETPKSEPDKNETLLPGNEPVKSEFPCLYTFIIVIIFVSVLLLFIVRKKQKGKVNK